MMERFLVSIDVGLPGAILRIALGLLLLPAVRWIDGEPGPWTTVVAFPAMLFGVKVAAAMARRMVASTEFVRSHWEWRRHLARDFDSYQWRKLGWYGVGLLLGGLAGMPGSKTQLALGTCCLLAGAAGEGFWRGHGLDVRPPGTI